MAYNAVDTQIFNVSSPFPLTSEEQLALQKFSTAFRQAMQKVSPPTTGLEKEISDVISDALFPDVLNNPVTRKRNMELLLFIVSMAVKHHLFLEFLFTEQELELIKESLQAYEAFLKLDEHKHHVIQVLLLNEEHKLQAALIQQIIALQMNLYRLRGELGQLYISLGASFKDFFDSYKENLLHPDSNHEIEIRVPGMESIYVKHNALMLHVGEYVADRIARQEVPIAASSLRHAMDRAITDYVVKICPDKRDVIEKDRVPLLPDVIRKLDNFSDEAMLHFSSDPQAVAKVCRILAVKAVIRIDQDKVNELAKNPQLNKSKYDHAIPNIPIVEQPAKQQPLQKKDSLATGPAPPTPVNDAEFKSSEVKSEAKKNVDDEDDSVSHHHFDF